MANAFFWPRQGRKGSLMLIMPVLIVLILIGIGFHVYNALQDSATTTGLVSGVSSAGTDECQMTIGYTVKGTKYSLTRECSSATSGSNRPRIGTPAVVHYNPSDPRPNDYSEGMWSQGFVVALVVLGIFVLGCVIVPLMVLFPADELARRLARKTQSSQSK